MTSQFHQGALALCALLSITAARAQTPTAAARSDDPLSEIVVTATRVAQRANQLLEPIIVIDRKALEDSLASDVGDVLRFHAGLDIGRSGGPGQPLALFIRGADSDQSIVMIDGVRINPGTLGGAPLQNLAPELFDRIEIVKGPRSAIYGTDAIGGVVNLITRRGGPTGADAMLGYGRYGTGEFSITGEYVAGAVSVQAALTGQRSNGFPTFTADSVDRGYKNLSGTAAVATRIAAVDVGAFYWRSTGTSNYAEPVYTSDYSAFASFNPADEGFANSVFAVHASGSLTDSWRARVNLSRNITDLRQGQADAVDPSLGKDYDYTSRDTVDLQNDVTIGGTQLSQVLTFGAILSQEQTDSLSFATRYSVGTHAQTYYLQDQLKAGSHRLLLAGGDYRHPSFGNHATWNAEYGYAATAGLLLTVSAGTAFRAPSATDRFGYGGNPDLQPESSRNFEAGIKVRMSGSQELSFAAFENTISNLIVSVFNPSDFTSLNENIDQARIRGLEGSWELHSAPWSLRAAADLQDPRNLVNDTQLLRRTRQSLTLRGGRQIGRGEFGVDLLQSGPRRDIDVVSGAPLRDGGYLLVALRARLAITPTWSVTVRLDNALDRRYQLASGYNTAGRAVFVATRYSFR